MTNRHRAYADLDIWETAMALAVAVHEATTAWPADEDASAARADRALGADTGSTDVAADAHVRPAASAGNLTEYHGSLAGELRRAAVSVATTIAEGQGQDDERELVEHLWVANGRLNVVETHLTLGHRLGFLYPGELRSLLDRCDAVGNQLSGLIQHLKRAE